MTGVAGVTIVTGLPAPLDQDEKTKTSGPLACHEGAVACSAQPCQEVTVRGPAREKPLTDRLEPRRARRERDVDLLRQQVAGHGVVAPLRSVAVSCTSR